MKHCNSDRIDGTSFHDTTIKTTLAQLICALGKPDYDNNTGEDKVNFEWDMETDNGVYFTVYDWKEYRKIKPNEVIEWHIGGFQPSMTQYVKREIMKLLQTKTNNTCVSKSKA